jgi:uncharacterized membrane protein
MKNYYVETSVSYSDDNGELYNGEEFFSFTIQEKNKFEAGKEAIRLSLSQFNEEYNDGFNNIKCQVETIYETSDDARSS